MDIFELLIVEEGLKLSPYKDTVGIFTVGVGRNLVDKGLTNDEQLFIFGVCNLTNAEVIKKLQITPLTKSQALYLLKNDIEYFKAQLQKLDWYKTLCEVRKTVILDMAFNLGIVGLLKFKWMIYAIEKEQFDVAARNMLMSSWAKQVKGRATKLAKIMETGKF